MASRSARTGSEQREPTPAFDSDLERRVLAARDRVVAQGPSPTSEPAPVDWTTGEGRERLDFWLRHASVPDEYRDVAYDRCRVENEVRAFNATLDVRCGRGEGALILGPVGTGKSSTAALVVHEAVKRKMSARWTYVPDLCDLMLNTYKRQEYRAMQVSPDVLVWDDFGVRPFSEFEIGVLDQIVEARYRMKKTMIITTNLTMDVLRGDPKFARMVDRWRQRNEAWVITGASQRTFGS